MIVLPIDLWYDFPRISLVDGLTNTKTQNRSCRMGGINMSEIKYPEELALLDKYLCGDKKSGESLFGTAYPFIKRCVFACTRGDTLLSESDKEDIISEAMMRAIDNQHLYNGSSRFRTFIIGYAKYIILEQRRKKAKDAKNCTSIEDALYIESINIFDNPLRIIIEKEQLEAVQKALNMLTEEQRIILTLRLFNNMPFKQLALLVGKSDDAVDSLYRRSIIAFKNNFIKIYKTATDF